MTDEQARALTTCPGCKLPKTVGLVVCWPCFKGRNGRPAFKVYHGTLAEWLQAYPPPAGHAELRLARALLGVPFVDE
jgi:hypothetical protein